MADPIGGIEAELQLNDAGLVAGFAKARQAMSQLESEMARLTAEERKGAIATAVYAAKMGELQAAQTRLAASMAAAAPRINAVNQALSTTAGGGVRDFGRGILFVSQGIEDLQYGFSAIVNNIPMMVMAFGGSAGLAGGISIASVGVNLLIRNWDKLMGAFGSSGTLTEAQRIEALGKQTSRTAEEQDRLNRYKREQKTIEDQSGRRPAAEGEIGKAVGADIGEEGADPLRAMLRRAVAAGMMPFTEAEIEKAGAGGTHGGMAAFGRHAGTDVAGSREAALQRLQDARNRLIIDQVNKLLANAESGPGPIGDEARRKIGALLPGAEGDIFRDPDRAARTERERANEEENEANFRRSLEQKMKRGQELTPGERGSMPREMREAEEDRLTGAGVAAMRERFERGGGQATAAEIAAALAESGMKSFDGMADRVLALSAKAWKERIAARAAERGISTEAAAFEIAEEIRVRDEQQVMKRAEDRLRTSGPRQQGMTRDLARRQAVREREVLDRLSGIDPAAEREYVRLLGASGGDPEKARQALEAQLREQFKDMGVLPAQERARAMARGTARGVNEDIARQAMGLGPVRNSVVMDASQLNASIQASITNENPMVRLQKQTFDELVRIRQQLNGFNMGQPVR